MFHVASPRIRWPRNLTSAGLASVVLLCVAGHARAQAPEFEVGPGLVVKIETTSTAPGLSSNAQQGVNRALAVVAQFVSGLSDADQEAWDDAMEELGPPETVTQDVTVYIKGARMRVDIGANSLLGRLAPDGTVSEWAILDPRSGQVMDTDFFDRAVKARNAAEYEGFGGDTGLTPPVVRSTGDSREIQGHTAQKYVITQSVVLATGMSGPGGGPLATLLRSETDAWVATDGPYTEDAGIVQFFRIFGDELNLNAPESSSGVGLPAGGMVLETQERVDISIGSAGGGPSEALMTATSSTVVKDISRQELDDELFAAFDREEKGCDCSCSAFKRLQAISEMPTQQQQNHPEAMSLAMCARECAGRWASFPRSVYEGGACPSG